MTTRDRQPADWTCSRCGAPGTVETGHVLLSRGGLRDGTLDVRPFCPPCAEEVQQ